MTENVSGFLDRQCEISGWRSESGGLRAWVKRGEMDAREVDDGSSSIADLLVWGKGESASEAAAADSGASYLLRGVWWGCSAADGEGAKPGGSV